MVKTSETGARTIAPGEDEGLADPVYRDLVDRLIARAILPGERIGIDATSRLFAVSQTPVRLALVRLEADGLVTRVLNSGYRAAPLLTRGQFEQLFDMRLLLEPYAASLAAAHHDGAQAEAMAGTAGELRRMAHKLERLTYGEFAQVDARLHDLIATASGNPLLRESQTRLHSHLHLFRLRFDARVQHDALGEHEQLLAAIGRRDARAASREMRAHLEASRARLRLAFRAGPLDT